MLQKKWWGLAPSSLLSQPPLVCDTVLEVVAEAAPQEKQRKLITEEVDKVIETLDRKGKELKDIQDKNKAQRIEFAQLVYKDSEVEAEAEEHKEEERAN